MDGLRPTVFAVETFSTSSLPRSRSSTSRAFHVADRIHTELAVLGAVGVLACGPRGRSPLGAQELQSSSHPSPEAQKTKRQAQSPHGSRQLRRERKILT